MQHDEYVNNIEAGALVAFKTKKDKVMSAMVINVNIDTFVVQTKAGTKFTISDADILWVKTGKLWPKKLFKDFKGVVEGNGKANGSGGESEGGQTD